MLSRHVRHDPREDVRANHLLGGPAEDSLGARVPALDNALPVELDRRQRRSLEAALDPGVGLAQLGRLAALLLGGFDLACRITQYDRLSDRLAGYVIHQKRAALRL